MKKMLCLALVCALLLNVSLALASDLGVQIIPRNTPAPAAIPEEELSLEDMIIGPKYKIPGYADVTLLSFEFADMFVQYTKEKAGDQSSSKKSIGDNGQYNMLSGVDWTGTNYYFNSIYWVCSGTDADYLWLQMDITNKQKDAITYSEEISGKAVYDNEYEYAGWVRQLNYNYDTTRNVEGGTDGDIGPKKYGSFVRPTLDPDDEFAIQQVYTGHYVIGCTLPNVVVEGEEPLRLEIQLGGNTLIYHIRK